MYNDNAGIGSDRERECSVAVVSGLGFIAVAGFDSYDLEITELSTARTKHYRTTRESRIAVTV
jgi:hypothetical protein